MLIPFKDDNPTRLTPYVTYGLVGLNVAVFLIQLMVQMSGNYENYQLMMYHFGLVPARIFEGSILSSITPFFTSIFMHGGLMHLGGNLLYLWIFADNIESDLGHMKFLIFYILCGIGASLSQVAIDWNSTIPIIGASGAISGVLGAYYLRFPRARVAVVIFIFYFIRMMWIPAKYVLGIWFFIQIFSGLTAVGTGGGGVAWFAHIGGFVVGIVFYNILSNIHIEISD